MEQTINIKEFDIVMNAKNHTPTILNPDFLRYNAIVPESWKLATSPICVESVAQVKYQNGIAITAQFDKLIISEQIEEKGIENLIVPDLASKYIKTLPHVDYQAIGINPKGHVLCTDESEGRRLIVEKLIAQGPWRHYNKNITAEIKLIYEFEDHTFSLNIRQAGLVEKERQFPIILFSGNFHFALTREKPTDKLDDALKILSNWHKYIDDFRYIVNKVILGEGK